MKNKFLQAAILAAITTVLTNFLLFSNNVYRLLLHGMVSSILFFLVIRIGFKIFLKKTGLTSKCLLLSFAAGIVNILCKFLRIFVLRLNVPLLGYIITFAVFFGFTLIMYKHIEGYDSTNIETTTQEKEFYKKAKELVAFAKKHWVVSSSIVVAVALIVTVPIIITNSIRNSHNNSVTVAAQEYLSGKTFVYSESDTKVYAYTFEGNTVGAESWSSVNSTTYGNLNDAKQYKATGSPGSEEIRLLYNDGGIWRLISTATLHEDGTVEFPGDEWTLATIDEIDKIRLQALCYHVFSSEKIIENATATVKGKNERTCSKCSMKEIYEVTFLKQNTPSIYDIENRISSLFSANELIASDSSGKVYQEEYSELTLVIKYGESVILTRPDASYGYGAACNSRGEVERVYRFNNAGSAGSFDEYDWDIMMRYTFGGNTPIGLPNSLSSFFYKSSSETNGSTTTFRYEYGGITYELKRYSPLGSGYYFTIYFGDTL